MRCTIPLKCWSKLISLSILCFSIRAIVVQSVKLSLFSLYFWNIFQAFLKVSSSMKSSLILGDESM